MANGFFQKVSLSGRVDNNPFSASMMNIQNVDSVPQTSFKDTISGLANDLNNQLNAPEKLMKSAMTGEGDVDVHDVMTAMAKAELDISIATQITSKVIQAYDKIMQISV